MNEPTRSGQSRILWIAAGLLALLTVFTVITLFSIGMLISRARTSTQTVQNNARLISTTRPVAQAVATPVQPQVIVQPPPEGTDFETAVLMQIYQDVNPSVVNIGIYQLGSSIHTGEVPGLNPDEYYQASGGSGFVWDADGNIVTNNHVVEGADRIVVRFSDGAMSVATLVGADTDSDLAVVKIDPTGFSLVPVRRGNLDDVRVGQRVAAIGNPFGLEGTLTAGIVSAIGRSIPARASFSIPASIQTDAPINPGNSGGPLLDLSGQVIGVNAQIETMNIQAGGVPGNSGVGFAIPASVVNKVVPQLIASGKARWSYLGIQGSSDFTVEMAQANNLAEPRGAYVIGVQPDGPATQVLKGAQNLSDQNAEVPVGGDVITAIDGEPIDDFDDLLSYVALRTEPGQEVRLTVLRGGTEQEITMTVGERPSRD